MKKLATLWGDGKGSVFLAFVIGGVLFSIGAFLEPRAPFWVRAGIVPAMLVAFCVGTFLLKWSPCRGFLDKAVDEHSSELDKISNKHLGWAIFLASALGLYFELTIIRWHSASLHMFNFFKNVSLISCFLGLGIGYARGENSRVKTIHFLPLLAVQFIFLYFVRHTHLQHALNNPIPEQLIMGGGTAETMSRFLLIYGFFAIVFTLNAITFVPLGHLASRLMLRKTRLMAYSWNLAGGLFGMLLFTGISMFWMPPAVWLVVGTMGLLFFFRQSSRALLLAAVSILMTLAVIMVSFELTSVHVYSPYQIISFHVERNRPMEIEANHLYFQKILDFRGWKTAEDWADLMAYYDLPYTHMQNPEDVLIVGSGTGNDVAAALRNGAQHIDAVEIDPVILKYGELFHPENPYADPRVSGIVNDARTYIRKAKKKYDMIVYALLDSHTSLSNLSSVRLDSFVYTVEAFRESRALLKDNGVLSLRFCVLSPGQGRKMYLMLTEAFDGQEPVVNQGVFFVGPGVPKELLQKMADDYSIYADPKLAADISTDDWPFLYMVVRRLPISYLILLVFLSALSYLVIQNFNRGTAIARLFSPVYFLLGAGFMLLETKNITQLGLTFGNTWFVVTIAIAGVLLMAFFANWTIMKTSLIQRPMPYVILLGFLMFSYFFPMSTLKEFSPFVEKLLTALILSLPFFFSGIAFSLQLRKGGVPISVAMSSNLMGAIVGGFLEYNAMYLGYQSLYVFAFVFYTLAFVFSSKTSQPA